MTRRWFPVALMLVVLVIAFGVRFHNLGAQSLWYDEGVAYGHSQRTFAQLMPALQNNVHVPAYFGSLALWEDFVGASEFGLRSLSAFFSVLSVALTFALGKRLFGVVAGVAAALFVTFNTFSIYYAQEARMYAMLAAVGAASMWVLVGFLRRLYGNDRRRILLYGVSLGLLNAIGIYTHYSYALVMLAQGIMAVLWLIKPHPSRRLIVSTPVVQNHRLGKPNPLKGFVMRVNAIWRKSRRSAVGSTAEESIHHQPHKAPTFVSPSPLAPDSPQPSPRNPQNRLRALLYYVAANLITIALFAPWLPVALRQVSAQPNISQAMPLPEFLRTLQGWFAFGMTFEATLGGMGIVVYFLLLFGLVVLPGDKRRWWALLLPVMWVAVSVGIYVYLELYTRYLRFLLPAQIGLALWMGRGVWVLWRLRTREQDSPLRFVPKFAAVFATGAFALTMAQGVPLLYHDADFQRDDYRGLAAEIAAITDADDAVIVSAPGLQEIFGYYYSGDFFPLPASEDIVGDTQAIIDAHAGIVAVLYGTTEQDPEQLVEGTLNANAYPINDVWWDDVRLVRYAAPAEFDDFQVSGAQFGEHITLERYALSATTLNAGDVLQVRLEWSTDAELDTRYKVFVQLLDDSGFLMTQRDSEPAGGTRITPSWQVGETIIDHHALPLDAPSGDYTLIIGLYDSNARLPVAEGDYLTLSPLTIR